MTTPQRPPLFNAIGWGSIALGALSLMGVLIGTVSAVSRSTFGGDPSMPGYTELMEKIHSHYWLFGPLQFCMAAAMITGGALFLKGHPRGRAIVEGAAWLSIAYNLGFGIWWVSQIVAMPRGSGPQAIFRPMMIGIAIGSLIFGAAPVILLLIGTRLKSVRQAFGPAQNGGL